ncbi:hypothetical protein [Novosphingobium sp.]|uniref:hypothetical protein n=1 Tax=Novosphingobium sp. TaxID=1874826 RepID=UPI00333F2CE5
MAIDNTGRVMKAAAAWQVALVIAVLVVALFAPRPGGAVLLIRIAGHGAALRDAIGRDIAPPLAVLRAGAIPGSLLVRADGPVPVLVLLRHGVLPLAAPFAACQVPAPGQTISR